MARVPMREKDSVRSVPVSVTDEVVQVPYRGAAFHRHLATGMMAVGAVMALGLCAGVWVGIIAGARALISLLV